MRYYDNEAQAKSEIISILKPYYPTTVLTVAERTPQNLGLRDVTYAARVKRHDLHPEKVINDIYTIQKNSGTDRIEWVGTKLDFINDNETEYILIKTVVQNG